MFFEMSSEPITYTYVYISFKKQCSLQNVAHWPKWLINYIHYFIAVKSDTDVHRCAFTPIKNNSRNYDDDNRKPDTNGQMMYISFRLIDI